MTKISFVLAMLVTLGLASSASAQSHRLLGSSGDVVIGAERLFGFLSTDVTTEGMGGDSTQSFTQISLLSGGAMSPYAVPRVALDGFVTESVSLGVTLGVSSLSTESEQTVAGTTTTSEGNSILAIVAGARVGYLHMFNDTVGIWPHLGVTYFTASSEAPDNDEDGTSGLALSLDATLVITPVQHFGFGIGPILDLGLTGTQESTPSGGPTTEVDTTITDWGIQAGLFGWL